MKRAIVMIFIAATLSGCSTAKPVIPWENYQRIATQEVAADKCAEQGFMDFQVAAAAKNFAAQDLNSWRYDPQVWQSVYASVSSQADTSPPGKSQCDAFSVAIYQRSQQQQQALQQQQLALQQQQQLSQSIQNAMPKTTYCNKVGWQTVCNTY